MALREVLTADADDISITADMVIDFLIEEPTESVRVSTIREWDNGEETMALALGFQHHEDAELDRAYLTEWVHVHAREAFNEHGSHLHAEWVKARDQSAARGLSMRVFVDRHEDVRLAMEAFEDEYIVDESVEAVSEVAA